MSKEIVVDGIVYVPKDDAVEGVNKPRECRFPAAVDRITVIEAIEILECLGQAITRHTKGCGAWLVPVPVPVTVTVPVEKMN